MASATSTPDTRPCLIAAWVAIRGELLGFLRHRLRSPDEAEDLLQEVFIKALRQGEGFCAVDQPRAWFFQVARHALADRLRVAHDTLPLPEDVAAAPTDLPPPVDGLSQCLPRVLSELSAADREAITFCDIDGHSQQALADRLGISLSGAKSRLQRARQRLKAQMACACQVRYDDSGQVIDFTPRPPLTT